MLTLLLAAAVALGDCPIDGGFVNSDLPDPPGTQIEISYRWSDTPDWIIAAVLPAGTLCMSHQSSPRLRCFRARWLAPDSDYSTERCEIARPSITLAP